MVLAVVRFDRAEQSNNNTNNYETDNEGQVRINCARRNMFNRRGNTVRSFNNRVCLRLHHVRNKHKHKHNERDETITRGYPGRG